MTKEKLSIYLGNSPLDNEKINWIPKNEKNPHLIAVGGSGSGKTETLKAIMLELKNQKVNSLILDFHNDFKIFADNLIQIDEATLHPLEIQINEKPLDVAYKVSKMIAKVFSLGDVQEAIIRDSIKNFYKKSGIANLKEKNEGTIELLPFSHFREIILASEVKGSGLQKLVAKISVLFDVDLFMNADSTSISLESTIKKLSVIELLEFPTDEVKSLVADLLLNKLINYLYIKGKSDEYWLYVVIDEAHRMMYDGSPVELLLRESRKYGVGVILASQRPTDFSETILANAGTILAFQSSLNKDAVFLSNQLRVNKEKFQKLKTAGLGYALFSSKDDSQKVQIVPVKDREEYKEIADRFDEDKASEYFIKEQNRIRLEKEKVEKLKETSKKASLTVKELEKELSKSQGELERNEYTINSNKKEIKELKKENVSLSHQNDKFNEKIQKKEQELEKLAGKWYRFDDSNKKEIKELKKENVSLSHQNDKFNEKIQKKEQELEKLAGKWYRFENNLKENKEEISSLNKKNVELNSEINKLSKEFETENKKNVTLIKNLEKKETKLQEVQNNLEERENEKTFLQNKIKYIKRVIEEEKDSILTRKAAKNIEGKVNFDLKIKQPYSFCRECHKELTEKEKYCDFCGAKAK